MKNKSSKKIIPKSKNSLFSLLLSDFEDGFFILILFDLEILLDK